MYYLQKDRMLILMLGGGEKSTQSRDIQRVKVLARESLYKSLSGERIPTTETLFKVIHALGFKLSVTVRKAS